MPTLTKKERKIRIREIGVAYIVIFIKLLSVETTPLYGAVFNP